MLALLGPSGSGKTHLLDISVWVARARARHMTGSTCLSGKGMGTGQSRSGAGTWRSGAGIRRLASYVVQVRQPRGRGGTERGGAGARAGAGPEMGKGG